MCLEKSKVIVCKSHQCDTSAATSRRRFGRPSGRLPPGRLSPTTSPSLPPATSRSCGPAAGCDEGAGSRVRHGGSRPRSSASLRSVAMLLGPQLYAANATGERFRSSNHALGDIFDISSVRVALRGLRSSCLRRLCGPRLSRLLGNRQRCCAQEQDDPGAHGHQPGDRHGLPALRASRS